MARPRTSARSHGSAARAGRKPSARRPRAVADRGAPAARPRILKLVGPSGVGKTTLAERLIARWTKEGLAVGYLKHAAHGFDLDRPGKDSFRAAAAGAKGVCLLGPAGLAYLETAKVEEPEDLVARFFAGCDLVLVEGFSLATAPALVFEGAPGALHPKPPPRGEVLAVIVAEPVKRRRRGTGAPVLGRDDLEGVLAVVERRYGLGKRAKAHRG